MERGHAHNMDGPKAQLAEEQLIKTPLLKYKKSPSHNTKQLKIYLKLFKFAITQE